MQTILTAVLFAGVAQAVEIPVSANTSASSVTEPNQPHRYGLAVLVSWRTAPAGGAASHSNGVGASPASMSLGVMQPVAMFNLMLL